MCAWRGAVAVALLVGCGAAHVSPAHRGAWLDESDVACERRSLEACEQALVGPTGGADACSVDLDGVPGDERVVVAWSEAAGAEVVVIDAACASAVRFASPSIAPGEGRGPTLDVDAWSSLPAATVRQWAATDRLPMTVENLWAVHTVGARHVVAVIASGPDVHHHMGYVALVVGCAGGVCRGDVVGHVEWQRVPDGSACGLARSALARSTGLPLAWVRATGDALEVHQLYETCDEGVRVPWRSVRIDASGVHAIELADPPDLRP